MADKIYLDIEVDDKGTMKKVAIDSAKLDKALQNAGKSARTADRNMKGASKQSSNSTKNFSKMAQGMSGFVVPAYATLAANVFALSAAFNFLKESGDLRVLQDSQVAYASATGIGLKTLTSDIKTASDGLIGFKDAASSAAIGIAAGLSTDQIESFAKGARDVSLLLGRDVTDSYNRLIRGVTKGEPELLDELGIILRLDTATQKYAATLGKSAKSLSTFEKSQAVAIEVQDQLDKKYSTVTEAINLQSNSVAKLGKAFEKVINPLRSFIDSLAAPVADILAENIGAFTALSTLFALPLVKSVIPNMEEWAKESRKAAASFQKDLKNVKSEMEAIRTVSRELSKDDPQAAYGGIIAATEGVDIGKSSGLKKIQAGDFESVTKKELDGLLQAAEKNKGVITRMQKDQRVEYLASLRFLSKQTDKTATQIQKTWGRMRAFFALNVNRMKGIWVGAMSLMKTAAVGVAKGIDLAFKGIAIISIAVFLREAAQAMFEYLGVFQQSKRVAMFAQSLKSLQEELATTTKEYAKFGEIQAEMFKRNDNQATLESVAALGQFASTQGKVLANISKSVQEINQLRAEGLDVDANILEEWGLGYEDAAEAVKDLSERAEEAANSMISQLKAARAQQSDEGKQLISILERIKKEGISSLSNKDVVTFEALLKKMEEMSQKANNLKIQEQSINDAYKQRVNSYVQLNTSVSDLISNIETVLEEEKEVGVTQGKANEARINGYKSMLELLRKIHHSEAIAAKNQAVISAEQAKAVIGATTREKEAIDRTAQRLILQEQINDLNTKISLAKESEIRSDKAKVQTLEANLRLLQAQKDELEAMDDAAYELGLTLRNTFQDSFSTGLADLIKNEESSLTEALRKVVTDSLKAAADTIAENLTKSFFGILSPSEKMKQAIIEGGEIAAAKMGSAVAGQTVTGSNTGSTAAEGSESFRHKSLLGWLFGENRTNSKEVVLQGPTAQRRDANGIEQVQVKDLRNMPGIFSNFIDSIQELFDPGDEAGFIKRLGAVFRDGASGFGELFKGIFGILMGGGSPFGGGSSGGIASILTSMATGAFARYGGIMGPGYSSGGIASGSDAGYLATLHGTEAVVPLPNNKSIPVDLQGAGPQNNVTVNVTVASDGSSTQTGASGQGANLGAAVARAVQKELQNQKRSGGILNPYGAA